MKKPLKNIIFDLGNVLFTIDFALTKKAFHAIGFTNFDEMFSQHTANELFEKLEIGEITNQEFYKNLQNLQPKASVLELQQAWNALLLHWREESVHFLKTLSKKYALYILSNTNDIHLTAVNNKMIEQLNMPSLDHLVTKAYYSHKINLRKPYENVFTYLAKDAAINPSETLFIDDTIGNIEAAAALGFKTHLLLDGELIEHLDYDKY